MILSTVLIVVAICFYPLEANAQSFDYDKNAINPSAKSRVPRQIVPGTKWCGNGNIAKNREDLGRDRETDMCCRDHDECPKYIDGHTTKYGLRNPDSSTRSHCDCDKAFFDCLKKARGISSTIGGVYFNLLQKKCFREKKCPNGRTCNNGQYEWVDSDPWLPTEKELKKLEDNIVLITPELQ